MTKTTKSSMKDSRDVPLSCYVRCKPNANFKKKTGSSATMRAIESPHISLGPATHTLLASGTAGSENSETREYAFTHVFDINTTQNSVFGKVAKPLLDQVMAKGGTGVLCAYGPSGAGKSYSIWGGQEERGIVARILDYIFAMLEKNEDKFALSVSVFDTSEKGVRDLVKTSEAIEAGMSAVEWEALPIVGEEAEPQGDQKNEKNKATPMLPVKGLSVTNVKKSSQAAALIEKCIEKRGGKNGSEFVVKKSTSTVGPFTHTHTGLSISLTRDDNRKGKVVSELLVLDLAGSCSKTHNKEGKKLRAQEVEASVSLAMLGQILQSLGAGGKGLPQPWTESILTQLLKPYLLNSVTSGTAMLVCGDDEGHLDDTINAFTFGHRCVNNSDPIPNDRVPDDPRYHRLLERIETMRQDLVVQKQAYERKLEVFNKSKKPQAGGDLDDEDDVEAKISGMSMGATDQWNQDMKNMTARLQNQQGQVERIQSLNASLMRKMAKKDTEIKKLQQQIDQNQDGYCKNIGGYRAERVKLADQIRIKDETLKNTTAEFIKTRAKDISDITARDNELLASQNDRVALTTSAFHIEKSSAQMMNQQKRELEEKFESTIRQWNVGRGKEITEIRTEYENRLKDKETAYQKQTQEFADCKHQKEADTESLVGELNLLYTYVLQLTTICEKVDQGAYQIQEKNGITRFVLTPQDKSTLSEINEFRIKKLKARLQNADKLLIRFQGTDANKWLAKEKKELEEMTEDDLRQEVQELRRKGTNGKGSQPREESDQQIREKLSLAKDKMLDELASNNTVRYIKQVEDERDFYKRAARSETNKHNGLRVAFQSQNRMLNSMQSVQNASQFRSNAGSRPSTSPAFNGNGRDSRASSAPLGRSVSQEFDDTVRFDAFPRALPTVG